MDLWNLILWLVLMGASMGMIEVLDRLMTEEQ
jgi:hypothetical protein